MIIGGLKMASALSRAEVICVRGGYRLLHNAGVANIRIAFFKPRKAALETSSAAPTLSPVPYRARQGLQASKLLANAVSDPSR